MKTNPFAANVEVLIHGVDRNGVAYPRKYITEVSSVDHIIKGYLMLYPACIRIVTDIALPDLLEINFHTKINPTRKMRES